MIFSYGAVASVHEDQELAALIAAAPSDPAVLMEIMSRYRLVPVAPGDRCGFYHL
ncbi:MAG: hypothetical protein JWM58_3193 [Rhizobium sp.]|nr:hypothetical protein [Rhizobium sp.]